jgi:hypothetical protein
MGLFGGGDAKTQETNPYKGLPDWAKNYYQGDLRRTEDLLGEGADIYEDLANNPQQFSGMDTQEKAALGAVTGEARQGQGLLDQGAKLVKDSSKFLDPKQKKIGKALDVAQGYFGRAEDALGGEKYESDYLDDVVKTTLKGMDRNAMRESVTRGASEAAFGGLSGTRGAVESAVAGSLHGIDRAATEAKLRSDAEKFAAEMGISEAEALRLLGSASYDAASDEAKIVNDAQQFSASHGLKQAAGLGDMASTGMDVAKAEAAARGTYGSMRRGIKDQNAEAERTAGRDAASWYGDLFNASRTLPGTQGGTTSVSGGGPSAINQALGTASTVAGIWSAVSDERAKEDIRRDDSSGLDKLRGLETYEYRYRDGYGDRSPTSGLMAQDLERSGIRGAVKTRKDGIKVVEPYAILATVVKAVRELDARTRPGAGLGEAT